LSRPFTIPSGSHHAVRKHRRFADVAAIASPEHAQEIFRAAFNSAWATYAPLPPDKRDEICHRIAWSAVKKEYRKAGNFWISR
jgi:cation transport regulator